MRSRDYRPFLDDIRQSCERVLRYTRGYTKEHFIRDEIVYDATLRHLLIIGEAVKQIPQEIRDQYPSVDWRQIGRFRDYVVHQYFAINNDIIWDVVETKVSELLTALKAEV